MLPQAKALTSEGPKEEKPWLFRVAALKLDAYGGYQAPEKCIEAKPQEPCKHHEGESGEIPVIDAKRPTHYNASVVLLDMVQNGKGFSLCVIEKLSRWFL